MLRTAAASRADIGPRDLMQDNVMVGTDPGYVVVADGVGSHENSDQAALIAVDTFASWARLIDGTRDMVDELTRLPEVMARRIAENRLGLASTTLAGAVLDHRGRVWVTNVGDSIVAVMTADVVRFVTREHQHAAYARMIGSSDRSELSRPNVLTRVVSGGDRPRCVDISVIEVSEPTVVLAASDGVTGPTSLKDIHDEVFGHGAMPDATDGAALQTWVDLRAHRVIERARTGGLADNASVGLLALVPADGTDEGKVS